MNLELAAALSRHYKPVSVFSSKTDDFHGIRRKCLLFGQLALSQHIESIFFTKLFIFLFGSCADSLHSLKHFHFDERQQTRKIINSFFRINFAQFFFIHPKNFPLLVDNVMNRTEASLSYQRALSCSCVQCVSKI